MRVQYNDFHCRLPPDSEYREATKNTESFWAVTSTTNRAFENVNIIYQQYCLCAVFTLKTSRCCYAPARYTQLKHTDTLSNAFTLHPCIPDLSFNNLAFLQSLLRWKISRIQLCALYYLQMPWMSFRSITLWLHQWLFIYAMLQVSMTYKHKAASPAW